LFLKENLQGNSKEQGELKKARGSQKRGELVSASRKNVVDTS